MGEVFFVIKGFVLTILIAMLLQVKIGNDTLEVRAERWLERSAAGEFITSTAAGGVKAIQRGYRWTRQQIGGGPAEPETNYDDVKLGPWKVHTKHRTPQPGEN